MVGVIFVYYSREGYGKIYSIGICWGNLFYMNKEELGVNIIVKDLFRFSIVNYGFFKSRIVIF